MAGAEYRPVFALFTSPDCGWCSRMKSTVLTDPDVRDLLKEYALVEIDVSEQPQIAARQRHRFRARAAMRRNFIRAGVRDGRRRFPNSAATVE